MVCSAALGAVKAAASCSALQQKLLAGFAGVQLAQPPAGEHEKGGEGRKGSSVSAPKGLEACDLSSATILPHPSPAPMSGKSSGGLGLASRPENGGMQAPLCSGFRLWGFYLRTKDAQFPC